LEINFKGEFYLLTILSLPPNLFITLARYPQEALSSPGNGDLPVLKVLSFLATATQAEALQINDLNVDSFY